MNRFIFLVLPLLAMVGCGSSSSPGTQRSDTASTATTDDPIERGLIDIVHASPDAPNVNVWFDGIKRLSNIRYKGAASWFEEESSTSVEVEAILPGTNAVVIGPGDIMVKQGSRTTVIALNKVNSIEPLVLMTPVDQISTTETQVRVVHGAPNVGMVDVYVTQPGIDLSTTAALGTFEFKGTLGPISVPAGMYQVRVTPAGDPDTVAYTADIELTGGNDVVAVAVENTSFGQSPISLVASITSPDAGESYIVADVLDTSTKARIRTVHVSPDAPAVDIFANNDFSAPLFDALSYSEFTKYLEVPTGLTNIKVLPDGLSAPSATSAVIDADVTLQAGNSYSVYATDVVATLQPLLLTDDDRPIGTEARVRLIHGSPTAGAVDIYVVGAGADITDVSPTFADIPFRAETGYVPLATGDYDVVVTPAGSKDSAIYAAISLENGKIYTAVARDGFGGGGPLGLILMDDFE